MELPEQIETWRTFFDLNKEYLADLHEQVRSGKYWINVEFADFARHNPELAELLLDQPEDILKAGQVAIEKMDMPVSSDKSEGHVELRMKNLPNEQQLMVRRIRSKHLNKLIQMDGIVRQKSDVRPQVTSARFECPSCGNIIPVLQLDTKFREPSRCGCGRKGKFKLLSKEMVDAQSLTLEESPEDLDGGEQPKRIKILLKKDLVSPMTDKKTNPGSKIIIVGAVKESPIILQTGGQSTRFDLIVDANSVETVQQDFTEIAVDSEEEKAILELSQDPDLFEKFVASIAPSIYGHDFIKQALLLQLFGGVHKQRDQGVKSRGDIHVLLIGDPGAGKSVLLKRISGIAPKARFVAGKGASGAGLTAAVVRDDFLHGWALEAGALVLANKGICCTTGDTQFIIENGQKMSFDDLFANRKDDIIHPSFRVCGLNTDTLKIEPFHIKQAIRIKNRKKIFKVRTRTGRELTLTEDNEVLTCANAETVWQTIQDATIGDFIAVPRRIHINGKDDYDEAFAYVAGLIASDGHVHFKPKTNISFYNTCKPLIRMFNDRTGSLTFGMHVQLPGRSSTIRGKSFVSKKKLYHMYSADKVFALRLTRFGIPVGNKSSQHPLSEDILTYSEKTIARFLRGMFDGDGSIRSNPYEVTLTTGIKKNAYLFQELLMRLGLISSVKQSTNSWHCSLRGAENCKAFYEKIGTEHPKKKERFEKIDIKEVKDRLDVLPNHQKLFKRVIKEKRGHLGEKRYKYFWNYRKKGVCPPRAKLAKLNHELEIEEIQRHVDSDVMWDKIVSKKETQADYVYDFTMKGTDNFVANNVIMHNCIDELDKMTKEDTSAMHEALEQQSISIAKANIQATLRCETTVLAAANPKFGRFDPYEMISKQIDLPPALVNRFDLIFPVRDIPNANKDEKLASFILSLHKDKEGREGMIGPDMIRKYIAYAKQRCSPDLTESAVEEIKHYFVKMRGGDETSGEEQELKPISISARQLEALIRLSEASARMRLSKKVTRQDAQRAIELVHYCLQQIGMDPETGKFDLDRVTTGISTSQRSHISMMKEIIQNLERQVGKSIPLDDVLREASIKGIADDTAQDVVERLKRAGDVYSPKYGFISRL